MLILYILGILGKIKKGCAEGKGAYVVKINVHVSALAQGRISLYMNSISNVKYPGRQATEKYFNEIFDAVNRSLEVYNVQVVGDYSYLLYEELKIPITPDDICKNGSIVDFIASSVYQKTVWPNSAGIGARIVVYSCPTDNQSQPESTYRTSGDCGKIWSFLALDVVALKKKILDSVEDIVTQGQSKSASINSQEYVDNLCNFVENCANENQLIGYFKKDLKNIRHNIRELSIEKEKTHIYDARHHMKLPSNSWYS